MGHSFIRSTWEAESSLVYRVNAVLVLFFDAMTKCLSEYL